MAGREFSMKCMYVCICVYVCKYAGEGVKFEIDFKEWKGLAFVYISN